MSRINGFVGRRNLLKLLGVGSAGIAATAAGSVLLSEDKAVAQQQSTPVQKPQPVSPDAAIKRLVEGNQRFVQGNRLNPNQSRLRLQETAVAQYPFAAILGCSDSRVPAEIVFDQGLGDLFVVRIAGNIAALEAIGSLEYATAVLGAQTIVVLGHARCGAVLAAIKGDPLPGRIGIFVEDIKPAIERIRKKTGNIEENAVIANVQYQVARLAESSTILANLIKEGKLKIVGGHYDLAKGKITLLS